MFAMGALGRQEWRDEGLRSATNSEACIENFADRLATSGATHIEECIRDPHVRIEHDLAVVSAPLYLLHRWQARSLRQ